MTEEAKAADTVITEEMVLAVYRATVKGAERKPVPVRHAHRVSEDSERLGACIADACNREEAVLLARAGAAPQRCSTCAGREGTLPNRCGDTLISLLESCSSADSQFFCHHGLKLGQEPTTLCAAYLMLIDSEEPLAKEYEGKKP